MKSKPKSKSGKFLFAVYIEGQEFQTYASNSQAAISKAAYRYAAQVGKGVGIIQWKIKQGELNVESVIID